MLAIENLLQETRISSTTEVLQKQQMTQNFEKALARAESKLAKKQQNSPNILQNSADTAETPDSTKQTSETSPEIASNNPANEQSNQTLSSSLNTPSSSGQNIYLNQIVNKIMAANNYATDPNLKLILVEMLKNKNLTKQLPALNVQDVTDEDVITDLMTQLKTQKDNGFARAKLTLKLPNQEKIIVYFTLEDNNLALAFIGSEESLNQAKKNISKLENKLRTRGLQLVSTHLFNNENELVSFNQGVGSWELEKFLAVHEIPTKMS